MRLLLCSILLSTCWIGNVQPTKSAAKPRLPRIRPPTDLRYVDHDLQRTLYWNPPHKINKRFTLVKYIVKYCPLSMCDKYDNLRCYEDDDRTKELSAVKDTVCKTSVLQLRTWTTFSFRVGAVYKDVVKQEKVKSKFVQRVFPSIERNSTLSAPSIGICSTKNSIVVNMSLPTNLTRVLKETKSRMKIIHIFCVKPSNGHESCSVNSNSHSDLRNYTTYAQKEPNTKYTVRGEYTLGNDFTLTSDKVEEEVMTLPDPFPVWAQIAMVIGICVIIIFGIFLTIIARFFYRMWKKINSLLDKELPEILRDTRQSNRTADGESATDLRKSHNWEALQQKKLPVDSECMDTIVLTGGGGTSNNYITVQAMHDDEISSSNTPDPVVEVGNYAKDSAGPPPPYVQQKINESPSVDHYDEITPQNRNIDGWKANEMDSDDTERQRSPVDSCYDRKE